MVSGFSGCGRPSGCGITKLGRLWGGGVLEVRDHVMAKPIDIAITCCGGIPLIDGNYELNFGVISNVRNCQASMPSNAH